MLRLGATPYGAGVRDVQGRLTVMVQRWTGIVWAHWRVEPAEAAAMLPAGVYPDTFDGSAWVGFIPFEMRDLRVAPGGLRLPAVGSARSFSEVNVRTYVTGPEGPGVWFHSLDATSRTAVAVARRAWALPYVAASIEADVGDTRRCWRVRRPGGVTGSLSVRVGDPMAAGALDAFLTARFRLYAPLGRRLLLSAPVRHRPWPLRRAELEAVDTGLVTAAGYRVGARPDHLVAGDAVDVSIGWPQLLAAGAAR